MKITKQGIIFNYNNDEITWHWWWARSSNWPFFSLIYNYHFKSFRQYWTHVGSVTDENFGVSKIRGVKVEDLLRAWAKFNCRTGSYALLYDVNPEAKPASFWRSIPDRYKTQLLSDAVVLRCKNTEEAISLCDAIDEKFARVLVVEDGYVIYWSWSDLE